MLIIQPQVTSSLMTFMPVWYENPSGMVIRPDYSKHKYRWSG